jgi:hypothetical protein
MSRIGANKLVAFDNALGAKYVKKGNSPCSCGPNPMVLDMIKRFTNNEPNKLFVS